MVEKFVETLRNFAVERNMAVNYLEVIQVDLRMEDQVLLSKVEGISPHVIKSIHVHPGVLARNNFIDPILVVVRAPISSNQSVDEV